MPGFVRPCTYNTKDPGVRKSLYVAFVRSYFSYCSQVWSFQSVNFLHVVERIQRRATKFILSLPFRTEVHYKSRLLRIGLLPRCCWHEYLDLIDVF